MDDEDWNLAFLYKSHAADGLARLEAVFVMCLSLHGNTIPPFHFNTKLFFNQVPVSTSYIVRGERLQGFCSQVGSTLTV